MSILTLEESIVRLLQTMEPAKGAPQSVTGTSNVLAEKPYRSILTSVRSDLVHFDDKKKERIIFTIEDVLERNAPDNAELLAVFYRILEVVQTYKDTGQILNSPSSKTTQPLTDKTVKSSCSRALFQDLNKFINQ